ncbi:hypothetical protein C8J57DRAFT_1243833 [Mycena rebaudengoi]|nr:hypothetical protein C8J57DRAFT_1243833 [Mycena rebaudengoi]
MVALLPGILCAERDLPDVRRGQLQHLQMALDALARRAQERLNAARGEPWEPAARRGAVCRSMAQSTALARYATAEVAKDAAVARASSAVSGKDTEAEAKGWRRDESGERLSERRAADATSDEDGEKLGGREVADIIWVRASSVLPQVRLWSLQGSISAYSALRGRDLRYTDPGSRRRNARLSRWTCCLSAYAPVPHVGIGDAVGGHGARCWPGGWIMMPPRQIGATRWRVAVLLERRMGRVVVMVSPDVIAAGRSRGGPSRSSMRRVWGEECRGRLRELRYDKPFLSSVWIYAQNPNFKTVYTKAPTDAPLLFSQHKYNVAL